MMLIMILCEGEHTYYHYQLSKCFKWNPDVMACFIVYSASYL